ncbi:MAG: DUF4435 domain-containing protein [Bacteroides sp.]|nr:DUF4435 domain-containing protein [Bacteroides sp.]
MLKLPPLADHSALELPADVRSIVIVGANGAGKSRFAARMAADAAPHAYNISALDALFTRRRSHLSANGQHPSADPIASDLQMLAPEPNSDATEFERLMWRLMRDEMLNLLNYKLHRADRPDLKLHTTKLDEVIATWQDIFPGNRVLIESGQLLFERRDDRHHGDSAPHDPDRYSALKLSAGEKAVIYYLAAISYAPHHATVFVDSPEMFLHPTMMLAVWNRVEAMRPDCTFVYTTHDLDFAASRTSAAIIWVRSFDARQSTWDYSLLPPDAEIPADVYAAILGARKPVLFIEGDARNSIDMKLYSLIFKDFTLKPLGSCNKVIEATRSFNDLSSFHQLDSYGIVDRDRRDAGEVEYLRRKRVMVPDVAEVENILMLEEVVRAVASHCRKDETRVFSHVKKALLSQFGKDLRKQALLHTRHRVKRTMEYRIDGRFTDIASLDRHVHALADEINPRGLYDRFVEEFSRYRAEGDYQSVLRVYNQKSMLPACNVAGLCGLSGKDHYISTILDILRSGSSPNARRITRAIRRCFNLPEETIITPSAK